MRIGKILEVQQPNIHKQLNRERNKKKSRRKDENLSFSDYMDLMKHDSYRRVKGRLRQK